MTAHLDNSDNEGSGTKSIYECRKCLQNVLTTLVADELKIKQDSEEYDKTLHDTIEGRKLLESKLSKLLAKCK